MMDSEILAEVRIEVYMIDGTIVVIVSVGSQQLTV